MLCTIWPDIMQSVKLSSPNYVSCDWLFNAWCKATLLAEARCGFKQPHSAKYSIHTKTKIFLLFNVYDMIRSVLKCRFGPIVLELCRIKMRTIWCGTIHVETAEEYEHSAQAHVTLFFSDKFKFNSNIVTTIYNTQVLLLCGRCSSGLHCSFLKPTTYYAPAFCRLSRRCMRNWNAGVCSDSHTCLCLTVKVQNVQALAAILYCRHMLLYLMLILKILNLLAYCQPVCRHSYS